MIGWGAIVAGSRQTTSGKWEFVIKRAGLLEKPIYLTFDTEEEGNEFCGRVEALLNAGIVPTEHQVQEKIITIADLVRIYERDAHPSAKDQSRFGPILRTRGMTPLARINAAWVDVWINEMKRVEKLAPTSIRARVGALARCTDWGIRKGYLLLPDNALRNLPEGYSQWTKTDAAYAGIEKRIDTERDRRLEPGINGSDGEHERILAVIESGVLPRQIRPLHLPYPRALKCLYILALETAMRLREMYTLDISQVDLAKRTVFLDKTKNGNKRQVPLSSVAMAELKDYLQVREIPDEHNQGALFPWWNGDTSRRELVATSDFLSKLFHNNRSPGIFDVAGCVDLKFHDLRHEAVSRLFERTSMSETEIMKISGHEDRGMMMRYANLRGSNLAEKLW